MIIVELCSTIIIIPKRHSILNGFIFTLIFKKQAVRLSRRLVVATVCADDPDRSGFGFRRKT